jgi:chemotaxis protein methyltransferase CheR
VKAEGSRRSRATDPGADRPLGDSAALRGLVEAELGIQMPATKASLLSSRLQPRLVALDLPSLSAYRDYLHGPGRAAELVELTNAVTTNKTDFFRETEQFDFLLATSVPEARRAGAPLRCWSAGCSTGEEPYTMAMLLAEEARAAPGLAFELLATDVSTRALGEARLGVYPDARLGPVPAGLRSRYFRKSRDASRQVSRVTPDLRRKVSFHALNFMDDAYAVNAVFDAIFFRNVGIYFAKPVLEAVVRKLCQHLRRGGYFFMGLTESLAGSSLPLSRVGPSRYRRS